MKTKYRVMMWVAAACIGFACGQQPAHKMTAVAPPTPSASDLRAVAGSWNVRAYGATGNGTTDDTLAIQRALTAAGNAGGGVVVVPPGDYNLALALSSPLVAPNNVSLVGSYQSAMSHSGSRYGAPYAIGGGTRLLWPTGGTADYLHPYLTLNDNGTFAGCLNLQPTQLKTNATPIAGGPIVGMRGNNPAVRDCEFLGVYWAIDCNSTTAVDTQRPTIERVTGEPIYIGISMGDQGNNGILDCARLTDIHWNPWWATGPDVFVWQSEHGEAFRIGDADEFIMRGCFSYGYRYGFRFTAPSRGAYGSILGCGADAAIIAVQVDGSEASYGSGLRFGQCGFVSISRGDGQAPAFVVLGSQAGPAKFTGCEFWSNANASPVLVHNGPTLVEFIGCGFTNYPTDTSGVFRVSSGRLSITGGDLQLGSAGHILTTGSGAALVNYPWVKGGLTHSGSNITIAGSASY